MSTNLYDDFLVHVLPYASNCPEIQAINAIRNSCIEFCRDTNFLQDDIDPITVEGGTSTYTVDVPNGYVLGTILSLYWDSLLLPRKSQAEIEKFYGRDWQTITQGTPQVFTQFDPDTFTVALTPQDTLVGGFTGRYSFVPTRNSTKIDSKILERYAEDIANGALARILLTPNEPYSDVKKALGYAAAFRVGKQNAAAYVKGGMARAPLHVYLKRRI